MDTIGDFLTIIRNASVAGKDTCSAPWSKMRESIAKILKNNGFIRSYWNEEDSRGHKSLMIALKHVEGVDATAITEINRKSKPGRRMYYSYSEIPRVLGGLGVSILSTSKGVISDRDARSQKVGGELICQVW